MQWAGEISKRKRGAVRLLFVVTLFLLGIQYALVETVSKPFPSIMTPDFAGHGGYESGTVGVRVMEVVFFDRVRCYKKLRSRVDLSLSFTYSRDLRKKIKALSLAEGYVKTVDGAMIGPRNGDLRILLV